jgi:EAL domain-containing protein (putative c-di-GMP-specific phosphodiesterase class I)
MSTLRSLRTELQAVLPAAEDRRRSGVHPCSKRVLIADDDGDLLAFIERALSSTGYALHLVRDGQEALEAFARIGPQVLVADIGMPHIDGLALARAARELDPHVQIVLMTGHPDVETATTAVDLGASRYLAKPFTKDTLVRALERAFVERTKAEEERSAVELLRSFEDEQRRTAEMRVLFSEVLDSLWIAYQPIVRALDGELLAHEALLRSFDPRLPSPGDVLSTAEHIGALDELGRVVRRRAPAPLVGDAGETALFVNLHPYDILDEDLFSPDAPLSRMAKRVVLELTERATLDHVPDIQERITRLRAMGFRIAIDDLGAGYATISTVALLEPEIVKLDMSLVRNVHRSRTRTQIVRHLVGMTHDAGGLVVAEGVETEDELLALVDLDCDMLQGFYIGRPAAWRH